MQNIENRLTALEQAANTVSAVTLNTLGAIINEITKLDSIDRQSLWENLESYKATQVQGGNQANYLDMLTFLQSRIF
ncbi:hypothetical protein NJI34_21900 [Pseudomonas sp. S 311-6]|uniref:hypothetical protein n=1 Tax=Pseudomonas TaxID=286 RepID=UPI0020973DDD|nr:MULTISPECIES: hypothetical protein [Pseudomonas]MCO7565127.1 hypothetical protein [Pseudomonas mosselii]MCO7616274.1 hypothetical protein [Pseudomonas guariconensis]MCO7639423.1 hypothetical protein [Pseudomonas sp. S 311-6]